MEWLLAVHLNCVYRTQFKPRAFPGLIITLRRSKRKPKPTASGNNMKLTVFESGALVLCGVTNPHRAVVLATTVLSEIFEHTDLALDAWQFQNIVGAFALSEMYDLPRMAQHCWDRAGHVYHITLDPEHSPAIQCRRRKDAYDCGGGNVVIQLHHTGHGLISGCRSIEDFFDEILHFVSLVGVSK